MAKDKTKKSQPKKVEAPEKPVENLAEKPAEKPKPAEKNPPKSRIYDERGGYGVASKEKVVADGEPQIRLKSLYRRPMDITLEHEVYCKAVGRCVCSSRPVTRWRRKEKGSKEQVPYTTDLRIAKSIRLSYGQESEPLHKAAEQCSDVRARLNCRPQHLKIVPVF